MKVQVTAKVEVYVTMEVEVADESPNAVESAMNEVLDDCSYSFTHDCIVGSDMTDQEISSYTYIE